MYCAEVECPNPDFSPFNEHSGKIHAMSADEASKRPPDEAGGMEEALVILCTCPDMQVAENLAGGLVENGLAACVNIFPQIRSIYRWQDELHNDPETLMIVKTSKAGYSPLEEWLLANHPYDVPEVLALRVEAGSREYLAWIGIQTGHGRTGH